MFVSFAYLNYGMDWGRFSLLQLMKPVIINPPSTYIELGGIFWVLLLFRDLKVAGMTKSQWVTMLASITAGMVVVRPSTALVLHGCGEKSLSRLGDTIQQSQNARRAENVWSPVGGRSIHRVGDPVKVYGGYLHDTS